MNKETSEVEDHKKILPTYRILGYLDKAIFYKTSKISMVYKNPFLVLKNGQESSPILIEFVCFAGIPFLCYILCVAFGFYVHLVGSNLLRHNCCSATRTV